MSGEGQSIDGLTERFAITGAVSFDAGRGGLPRIVVTTPAAEAHVYAHGAHVTHYQPAGHEPVLFVSRQSSFEHGKPIRGGVPICFPWFAVNENMPDAPSHGFARTRPWQVSSAQCVDGGAVELKFLLTGNEDTRAWWPHDFELQFIVTVGAELTMSLELRNDTQTALSCEQALHTYFAVADARSVSIHGLGNCTFFDKVDGGARKRQPDEPITFTGETDRIYQDTEADCVLEDPSMGRRIINSKSGSRSTVVWNPWQQKAAAMGDFGDDEWPGMVCIETANAGQFAVTLEPGRTHSTTARIGVEKI